MKKTFKNLATGTNDSTNNSSRKAQSTIGIELKQNSFSLV